MTYKPGQFINLFVRTLETEQVILEDKNESIFVMPNSEQSHKLQEGSEILAILFNPDGENSLSESDCDLLASMKLEKHANYDISQLKVDQKVDLFIINETDLGYKCIVNGEKIGLLYKNEVFKQLLPGEQTEGYIAQIRADHRIDLKLRASGHQATTDIGDNILEQLKLAGGFLAINDKTTPEKIYELFGVSKKKYKIALGGLYKKRLILVSDEGIRLITLKK